MPPDDLRGLIFSKALLLSLSVLCPSHKKQLDPLMAISIYPDVGLAFPPNMGGGR